MDIFYIILYIILALFIGSFLNVVALRVPKKESIIKPGSHCPSCEAPLKWRDLIPVFSYVFSLGRCRSCNEKISPLYLLGELTTLILFLLIPIQLGFQLEMLIAYPLMMILVVVLISDLKYQIIPDRIIYPGIVLMFILRIFVHPLGFWDYIIGAFVGGVLLFIIAIISRGGMGGGDIKLFFLLGLALGWQGTLLTLLIAVFAGTLVGVILLLSGKVKRGEPIAFGPYIVVGAIIAYFWGAEIISWYVKFFMGA